MDRTLPERRNPRRSTHNYRAFGYYFITICIKGQDDPFGFIAEGQMHQSRLGEIAHHFILRIEEIRKAVTVDTHVVMPDHVHVLLFVQRPKEHEPYKRLPTGKKGPLIPGAIGTIINHYKGAVTKQAQKMGLDDFRWQSSYHDRIIRSKKELRNVRAYIKNNPKNWKRDDAH